MLFCLECSESVSVVTTEWFSRGEDVYCCCFWKTEYIFNRVHNNTRYPAPSVLLTCFLRIFFLRVPSPSTMMLGDCDVTQCIHWSTLDIISSDSTILWFILDLQTVLPFFGIFCVYVPCAGSVRETESSIGSTAGTTCRCVFKESSLPDHGRQSVYWKLVPRLKEEGNLTKRTCDQLSAVIIN